jgi:hypothetical protein
MVASGEGELPKTPQDWLLFAQDHQIGGDSTLQSARQNSGSKIETEQFILLRALWDPSLAHTLGKAYNNGWVRESSKRKATEFLKHLKSWNAYLRWLQPDDTGAPGSRITSTGNVPEDMGSFSFAAYYQYLSNERANFDQDYVPSKITTPRVTRSRARAQEAGSMVAPTTPTPGPRGGRDNFSNAFGRLSLDSSQDPGSEPSSQDPDSELEISFLSPIAGEEAKQFQPTRDEQIVNTALITFLTSLTIHYPGMENEWSYIRQTFTVSNKLGKKVYAAAVDGLLRVASTEEPRIIVEVKPNVRRYSASTYDKIRMQEAAQMAAWIAEYPYLATQPKGSANTQYRCAYNHLPI